MTMHAIPDCVFPYNLVYCIVIRKEVLMYEVPIFNNEHMYGDMIFMRIHGTNLELLQLTAMHAMPSLLFSKSILDNSFTHQNWHQCQKIVVPTLCFSFERDSCRPSLLLWMYANALIKRLLTGCWHDQQGTTTFRVGNQTRSNKQLFTRQTLILYRSSIHCGLLLLWRYCTQYLLEPQNVQCSFQGSQSAVLCWV